jgi:hypothetical protein
MKRLVVIFAFALLLMSAGKTEAGRYLRCYNYGPRPFVVCRIHHRAWVPGYWRWSWRYNRYFWINGYWY